MTPEPADNPTSTTSTDVPTDAKKSAWQGQFAKWAFAGVTALALIGALVSVWTVFKLNGIQEILAKQTSDVSTQAVEARVSAKQAEETLGIHRSSISNIIKGKSKSSKGIGLNCSSSIA